MRRHAWRLVLLLSFAALVAAIRLSGLGAYLTLESLKAHEAYLIRFVEERYAASVLLYVLVYTAVVGLALPGAAIMTLAGGLLFHTFPGVVYVNVGATAGAVVAFAFSRHVVGNWLQGRYGGELARFNGELDRNGFLYLLVVRLVPVFPFFLVNVLCGLTRVRLRTFLWTTSAGILPASIVYAFAGSQIGRISSISDLASGRLLAAFLLLALLALLPLLWRKARGR